MAQCLKLTVTYIISQFLAVRHLSKEYSTDVAQNPYSAVRLMIDSFTKEVIIDAAEQEIHQVARLVT